MMCAIFIIWLLFSMCIIRIWITLAKILIIEETKVMLDEAIQTIKRTNKQNG